jgi:hypothetical protein
MAGQVARSAYAPVFVVQPARRRLEDYRLTRVSPRGQAGHFQVAPAQVAGMVDSPESRAVRFPGRSRISAKYEGRSSRPLRVNQGGGAQYRFIVA